MRVYKIEVGTPPFEVSVIVPAKKLRDARNVIFDLKNQQFKNYEIICVTGKGRIAKAWNLGIEHSRGKIVLFTESDCRLPNDWIKEMVKIVRKNRGVAFGSEVIATSRMLSMASFGAYKSILKQIKFDEEFIIGEDTDFFERLKRRGYKLERSLNPVVFHFKSQDPIKRLKWSFLGGIMRVKHWSKYETSQLNNLKTIFVYRLYHILEETLAILGSILGFLFFLPQIIRKFVKIAIKTSLRNNT